MTGAASRPGAVVAAFATIYLVWGVSFLANKLMVADLPPILAAGVRFTLAGLLLGAIAAWRGAALPATALEWRHVLVMGLLTVLVSNTINTLALRHVASNQAALLNASSALWIALLGTVGARAHRLTARATTGLALGFLGVALLVWPRGGYTAQGLGWQLAIVGGCFGWALATVYYRVSRVRTAPLMFTAMQMLVGGLATATVGLAAGGGDEWQWTWRGTLSLLYLVVFASCLAYTAFAYLMPRTTPARLGTYAYVNPVVAALAGWLALGETLSALQLAGTVVILGGVALVTWPSRAPAARGDPQPDEPPG